MFYFFLSVSSREHGKIKTKMDECCGGVLTGLVRWKRDRVSAPNCEENALNWTKLVLTGVQQWDCTGTTTRFSSAQPDGTLD